MIRRPTLVAALALALAALHFSPAAAQVAAGSTRLSMSGSGFIGSSSTNLTNIFGLSRFGASGFELGGDLMLSVQRDQGSSSYEYDYETGQMIETDGGESTVSTTGFFFGRLAYNFIGESMTVPFLSVGIGAPITDAESSATLVNLGGGFKKFLNERASFDIMANYQGQMVEGEITWQDGLSLIYGLSFYVGGND